MADPIRQLLSQTSYVADGVSTVWNFSFSGGYLDKSHVKAKYLDADRVEHQIAVTLGMFLGQYQLNITPPVAAGNELVIYRDTPKSGPLVDFIDAASLTEASLDLSAKQGVFVAAESSDLLVTTIASTDQLQAKLVQAEAARAGAAAAESGSASQAEASASSAAEALGYLQAYRATSYGALNADPVVDPLGNPPTVGDEYFNTSANLLKRWNGGTWQASDISTANLAAVGGAGLVGANAYQTQDEVNLERVSVKRFGAKGDGVTDDTAAIQQAIDYALYLSSPKVGVVHFPAGSYKTSDTLHLGYGTGYTSITITGAGGSYNGEVGFGGSRILPTFSDRPAINVQGARRTRIKGIAIVGQNNNHIRLQGLGGLTPPMDDTASAAWVSPLLHANATGRYCPYAGISVDAYSGSAPVTAYPSVTYPAFLGATSQYNKSYSSNVLVEDCYIAGFVAAVAVQPGNSDGNGDYVSFRDCTLGYSVYGISVGQSQSRQVNFYNGQISSVHTCLVNNKHGRQIGKFGGIISGSELGACIQLFDLTTGFSGPLLFEGCYGELIWRIGNTNTPATSSYPYSINGCEFAFISHPAIRGVPKLMVDGGGNVINVRGGTFTMPSIGSYAGTINIDGTTCISADMGGATAARSLAQRSSGGLLPLGSNIVLDESKEVRTNEVGQLVLPKNFTPGGRTRTIGRLVQSVQWREAAQNAQPVPCSRLVESVNRVAAPLTITGISGTIDFTGSPASYGSVRAGDLVQDDVTGTVFLCTSYTGLVASVTALNNYYNPGSGYVLRTPIPGTGNWYTLSGRYYSTSYPLYGDRTAGSAVITNCNRGDGYGLFIGTDLAVGDYLMQGTWLARVFGAGAYITAIDATAKTITMSAVAAVGSTATAQPFHFWVRG